MAGAEVFTASVWGTKAKQNENKCMREKQGGGVNSWKLQKQRERGAVIKGNTLTG
jgi:hypothetical protein